MLATAKRELKGAVCFAYPTYVQSSIVCMPSLNGLVSRMNP